MSEIEGGGVSRDIRNHILRDIDIERDRQNEKWGGVQDLPSYTYLAIATEELGEAAQAALHDEFGGNHAGTLRTELVQLAAVIVQWLERIDADLLYEDRPTDDDFREAVRVATGIVLPTMRDAAVRVVEGVIAKRLPPRTDKHDPIWDMADIEELASDVCHALGLEQP